MRGWIISILSVHCHDCPWLDLAVPSRPKSSPGQKELCFPRLLPPPEHLSHLSALPELCPRLSQIEISLLLKKE